MPHLICCSCLVFAQFKLRFFVGAALVWWDFVQQFRRVLVKAMNAQSWATGLWTLWEMENNFVMILSVFNMQAQCQTGWKSLASRSKVQHQILISFLAFVIWCPLEVHQDEAIWHCIKSVWFLALMISEQLHEIKFRCKGSKLQTARNLCWGVSELNQYIPIHNVGFIRLLSSDPSHTWLDDVLKMTALRSSLAQTHN